MRSSTQDMISNEPMIVPSPAVEAIAKTTSVFSTGITPGDTAGLTNREEKNVGGGWSARRLLR